MTLSRRKQFRQKLATPSPIKKKIGRPKKLRGNHARTRLAKVSIAETPVVDDLPPVPPHNFRPQAMKPAKLAAMEGMRQFGTLVYASRFSQIGRSVLLAELKTDGVFREGMRRAKQEWLDELETAMGLRGMLPRGDLAGIFILKHNRGRYREIQRVELSGSGGGPVQYMDVKAELLRRLTKLTPREDVPLVVNGVEVRRGLPPGGVAGSGGSAGSRGVALVRDDAPEVRKVVDDDPTAPRRKRRPR